MYILGISCFYHDASASLLKDGEIVAAAQEERFTRRKHDTSFPINSIEYCLQSQNITIKDVAYLAFYEKPLLKFERILHQHIECFPKSYKTFVGNLPDWMNEKLRVMKLVRSKLKYGGDVFFVEHHLAHAANFLVSPFKEAAILSIDGVGEWTTTAYGKGKENKITLFKEIKFPHSIGLLYSAITAYLGFSVNNSEYKVMGLSAYGDMNKKTNKYYNLLKKIIDIKEDGSYRLDMGYFKYHFSDRMPSRKLCELLESATRKDGEELTQRHKNIAAALQMITEEVIIKILNHLYKETKCDNLIISGGVGLNSVGNGKILKKTKFKKIWIQPDPGDAGASVGAAAFAYFSILGNKRSFVFDSTYLGAEFSSKEIKKFLDENKITYLQFKNEKELVKKTAQLIYEDNVVGWFQGRMEFGPRALGSRSILANPCNPKAKELLNLKVKHREEFRPFAPVVCEEDAKKYFDVDKDLLNLTKYMLAVCDVKKEWKERIPAVTHVDGSGRVQTIKRKDNELYYVLIKEFGKISSLPILINTSFNIRGEPIVCAPYDAYKCMMGTGIDLLVMGNFLIKRGDNLKDSWNSEKLAND